jgi:8-oxo-dGTP diphosphatase
VIADYACTPLSGTLRAGDDALEVRFVDRTGLAALPLVDLLVETLTGWDALPG